VNRLLTILLLGLTLVVGGCAENPNNEQSGAVIGAILGGIAGSNVGEGKGKTAATIAGTIAGALIGGRIGRYMDETDRLKAQQALERNRTHEPAHWRNPDTGYEYTVTPEKTYKRADNGEYCREYQTEVKINGRIQKAYGTACRQPDGSWKVAN